MISNVPALTTAGMGVPGRDPSFTTNNMHAMTTSICKDWLMTQVAQLLTNHTAIDLTLIFDTATRHLEPKDRS